MVAPTFQLTNLLNQVRNIPNGQSYLPNGQVNKLWNIPTYLPIEKTLNRLPYHITNGPRVFVNFFVNSWLLTTRSIMCSSQGGKTYP